MSKENTSKIYLKLIVCMIFVFAILPFITSAPPQSTVIDLERGVDIIHPETLYLKEGNNLEFNFWTYNSTTGATLTNTSLNCTVYFINNSGYNFYRLSNQAGANGLITYGKGSPLCANCWTAIVPSQNLTIQDYSYQIKCQGANTGGYETGYFQVNYTGTETSQSRAIIYGVLLFALIFFLLGTMTLFIRFDNLLTRVGMFGLSYLLLIAIIFVSWQISNEIIFSNPFLINFFRLFFIVLVIGAFPLLLGGLAWYVIMLFRIKEIERLMEKGLPYDEAEHRVNRRKR